MYLAKGFAWLLKNKVFNTVMIFATLWLLSQMITDVYRSTPFEDWTRGWAKIIFFMIDFIGVALLTRFRMDRIATFLAGIAVSYLLQTLFFPDWGQAQGDFVDGPWKFGYSPFLSISAAVFGASALARRLLGRRGEYLFLILTSLINLIFNFRSAFALSIAAAAFGILKQWIDRWPKLRDRITPLHFVYFLIGGVVFSQGLIGVYAAAASNNWLGYTAKEKYEAQTAGDLSLLQSGRAEIVGVDARDS